MGSVSLVDEFRRDGFAVSSILTAVEARAHRSALELAETVAGPLHYRHKVHTLVPSALELATLPSVLDVAGEAAARLVRGTDPHGYFNVDPEPPGELSPESVAEWSVYSEAMNENFEAPPDPTQR